jgi:hypothetical protein
MMTKYNKEKAIVFNTLQMYRHDRIEYLEKCLKEEAQTYNSKQLAEKLDKERGIKVSTNTIRRGLKKKG